MHSLNSRYSLFMRIPLLQGISSRELLDWEEKLRLDLDDFPASDLPLIRQGDACTGLLCLLDGTLERRHSAEDGTYQTRSYLTAPAIIEADRLFGLHPKYTSSYRATTEVTLLSLRKQWINNHMMKNDVFRINLLNLLSACAQKRADALMPQPQETAEQRLRAMLHALFGNDQSKAELTIQMKTLARYIGATRLATSKILHQWDKEGLIRLGRGHFVIMQNA